VEELYHVEKDDSIAGSIERDDGVLHRAGMVFLMRSDGKILITRRSLSKETFPDAYYSSCAFDVSFGETYEEAARRELFEETGIHDTPEYLGEFSFYEPPENGMVAVFKCKNNELVGIDRKESIDSHWYST